MHHKHMYEEDDCRYRMVESIGNGTFGCVVLAKDVRTGECVAIKQMEREYVHRHYVCSEILNHSQLQHPHVIGFREVFLSRRHINIVMDYAPGGSLLAYTLGHGRLSETVARWFFQQLMLAVDYCHKKGVANRDIKLDNLLLHQVDGQPQPLLKICDFGYSKSDERSEGHAKVGTLHYMAPEVLHNNSGSYDARLADIWSCGVVLYAMLTGRFPFAAPQHGTPPRIMALGIRAMLTTIKSAGVRLPADLLLSPPCVALLRRLLQPDPRARITVAEVLEDPWFLQDLPANALSMNATYLGLPPATPQSPGQIRAVVEAIRADSDDDCLDRLSL